MITTREDSYAGQPSPSSFIYQKEKQNIPKNSWIWVELLKGAYPFETNYVLRCYIKLRTYPKFQYLQ